MRIKFSKDMLEILSRSREEALRTGSYGMGVDHLMLGILRKPSAMILSAMESAGITPSAMKQFIDSRIFMEKEIPYSDLFRIQPTKGTQSVLNMASLEALREGTDQVDATHLLIAICKTRGNATSDFLTLKGVEHETIPDLLRKNKTAEKASLSNLPKPEGLAAVLAEQLQNAMNFQGPENGPLS